MTAAVDVESSVARLFGGDAELVADPYPTYRTLRERGPVFSAPTASGEPCWHVVGHREATEALRSPQLSSGPLGNAEQDPFLATMLVNMDPPDHTRVRRLMHRAFTPHTVEHLREQVGRLVDSLLDDAEQRDGLDVVADLADPLPTQVIASLLGVPPEDWAKFKSWSSGVMTIGTPPPDAFVRGRQMGEYLFGMVHRRRAQPQDDLISALVAARDRGDMLTDFELVAQCVMLLVGGHETTTSALGSGLHALLVEPTRWAAFREATGDPVATGRAVDELLRYEPPFQFASRTATVDLELGGAQVPAGQRVWVWIGAANRDPARFDGPDELDLGREPNPHLAFGHGVHSCLGAALARLNLGTALTALSTRYPDLALAGRPGWRPDLGVRGPERLPVRRS